MSENSQLVNETVLSKGLQPASFYLSILKNNVDSEWNNCEEKIIQKYARSANFASLYFVLYTVYIRVSWKAFKENH